MKFEVYKWKISRRKKSSKTQTNERMHNFTRTNRRICVRIVLNKIEWFSIGAFLSDFTKEKKSVRIVVTTAHSHNCSRTTHNTLKANSNVTIATRNWITKRKVHIIKIIGNTRDFFVFCALWKVNKTE